MTQARFEELKNMNVEGMDWMTLHDLMDECANHGYETAQYFQILGDGKLTHPAPQSAEVIRFNEQVNDLRWSFYRAFKKAQKKALK